MYIIYEADELPGIFNILSSTILRLEIIVKIRRRFVLINNKEISPIASETDLDKTIGTMTLGWVQ